MKRLYTIIMALATLVVSANAQSLSVQNIEAQTGEDTQLVVSLAEGTFMTALQFNLSLPEGVTLATSGDTYGATLGEATDGHTLSVQPLASGDLLFILYSMEQKAFRNGELLRIPLQAGDAATTANGKLYTVRTATAAAVSHPCADASFSAQVTEPEPATRSPFKGEISLPGIIEAENFDKGGEGIAYHDSDAEDHGGTNYRSGADASVDIVTGNGGHALGWTAGGEWIEYSVNVAKAGKYTYEAIISNGTADKGGFSISLVGKDGKLTKLADVSVPSTAGDWENYQPVKGNLLQSLEAGSQIFRITITDGNCNIDKIKFEFKEDEPEPTYKVGDDITSLAPAEWEGMTADYGGLANPAVERYTHAAPEETGDILTQTVTGLRNGTYKVQLDVAASFTPDRGFTCPTGNGLSVAFANGTQENLPVVERGWVDEGDQNTVTLTTIVTDRTLKYGIKNLAPSGNWFVARVISIVYVSESEDEPEPEPDYKSGDANGDGSVNVFDVTAIVNYILGSPSDTFIFKAADVNNDENVNVFDVTRVVNIILGVDVAAAKMRYVAALDGTGTMLAVADGKETNIVVDNATQYIAMQFDVVVPENSNLQNVALNNTAGHALAYRQVESNRYRVIAYSTQNSTFEPTEEALVSLSFSDGNKAEIENAQFITANGHSIFMVLADEATNIVEVEGDIDEDAIYNMAGQYAGNDKKALPKGVYICNGKKFVVQ